MSGFRNYPVYRDVEIVHPEYPDDAPPFVATIQRNLTFRQIDELRNLVWDEDGKMRPSTTVRDFHKALTPYVKAWNLEAETEDGTMAPVPPPMDGGADVFQLLDDYFAHSLFHMIRNAHLGGAPGTKEAADRKNSLAASESTLNTADAESTPNPTNETENSTTDSDSDSSKVTTMKPGSRRKNSKPSTA